LEKRNADKNNNERHIMKTSKNERNENSRTHRVTKAATKVAVAVTAGIAGRCLLP
jgi:hypothetical protein